MHAPVDSLRRRIAGLTLLLCTAVSLHAQSSNQVWFTVFNGQPTPSSDVSVGTLFNNGYGSTLPSGSANTFVSQTNFSAFNSPYGVVVDPAMGKAYVVDNNAQDTANASGPEYIYSFNLTGTPSQIAASAQVIYTMLVPAADVTANLYPLLSGLALDSSNHFLYFNQTDATTATNSYIGRLDLASSSASNVHSSSNSNPVLRTLYVGQVPGLGALSLDQTNLYLGSLNYRSGNSGMFTAPRDGSGAFSELFVLSTNDVTFTNGFVGGVACDSADHLVYFLTYNAGFVNFNFNTNQNAVWTYDLAGRYATKIASGYAGFPDNIAVDPVNQRYYFTVGRSALGSGINAQGIYTGTLRSFATPTLFYTPTLSGLDVSGSGNSGNVVVQGVFVVDPPVLASLSPAVYPAGGASLILAPGVTVTDPSSTLLAGATIAITSGTFTNDGDILSATTNGTQITAAYNPTNETLTLLGSDTVTNYQQVLQSVAFRSTRLDPSRGGSNTQRSLAWTVTDGVLSSMTSTSTITTLGVAAPATNRIAAVVSSGGWLILYSGTSGKNYTVQSATSLTGPWSDLSSILTANSLGLVSYTDSTFPLSKSRFYRVKAD